jgi:putative N6-adenine-specific DNA methylase
MNLAKKVGLKAAKKTPFFNGDIECRLLKYELYQGKSMNNV